MNKWTLKSLAAVAVGFLAWAGQANAAVSYSYVTDAPDYPAAGQGSAVTVKLYLLETLTGGSTSVINSDGGLLGYGVRVNRTVGDAKITNYDGNNADFGTFPNPPPTVDPAGVPTYKFTQAIGSSAATGVATGNGGANAKTSAVYLGNVTIAAGATTSTFQVLPYDNAGGNTLTNNSFFDLDFNNANPAFTGASAVTNTFTVSVVPEPTFAGVAVVLGAAGSLIRRRRQEA